jgi:hypothetical protein
MRLAFALLGSFAARIAQLRDAWATPSARLVYARSPNAESCP